MPSCVKLNKLDNVEVLLEDNGSIPKGHKIAFTDIKKGEHVIKYGKSIGIATCDIKQGEHIHSHNLSTGLQGTLSYNYAKSVSIATDLSHNRDIYVYQRDNGEIGIRNELWVIPTVGCVNTRAKAIVDEFKKLHPNIEGIDEVTALTHSYGCSEIGDDHERTALILKNFCLHPNAGGVLVLGLGCENNQIESFRVLLGNYNKDRIIFLKAQDVEDEVAEGVKILEQLYNVAKNDKRVKKDLSSLKIGLKCGGSDGFSGITANVLVGKISDNIINFGGTALLTEVPEMFGAETCLMERAKDKATFDKIVNLINDFKLFYESRNQPCYENPSPGNKAGGITTLEEKSLGCIEKSGSSEVIDVLKETERLKTKGLNLINGPGNDIVATTTLASAGCHLILFTTGRGTPLGNFVPTIKISTNTDLYNKKRNWIDFDAGVVLKSGGFEKATENLLDYIQAVASGKKTANEQNCNRELLIFKTGVTL